MIENDKLFDIVLGINHCKYAVTSSTGWVENGRVERRDIFTSTNLTSTDEDLASDSLGLKHPHGENENKRLTINGNNEIRVSKGETLGVKPLMKRYFIMRSRRLRNTIKWAALLKQSSDPGMHLIMQ